jgi:hypothetical protein
MPQTETIFGRFDPAHPRTVVRRDFIGDEVYEEREVDLEPYDGTELDTFVKGLYTVAEGMNNPRIVRHESWNDYSDRATITFGLWHTRPATELELLIAEEHRAKIAARAKKNAETQKKSAEAAERKQYAKLKKKYG